MRLTALLNVHSYFSFGAEASSPTALVKQAAELGYQYVALTDTGGVYGVVELHQAAKQQGIKALTGATLVLEHSGKRYPVVLLAGSRQGYATLNELIDLAKASEGQTDCHPLAVRSPQS